LKVRAVRCDVWRSLPLSAQVLGGGNLVEITAEERPSSSPTKFVPFLKIERFLLYLSVAGNNSAPADYLPPRKKQKLA